MKTIWTWLDGKKTNIAAVSAILLVWAQNKGYLTGSTANLIDGLWTAWTGVALTHNAVKAKAPDAPTP